MTDAHPSEEQLESLALHPGDAHPDEMRAHVNGCPQCRSEIAAMRAFCTALSDPQVWRMVDGPPPSPQPPAEAMQTLDMLRFEDEIASFLLEPLLNSTEPINQSVLQDSRYRSAGVVRRLVSHSETARADSPLHALSLVDAAVFLAEQLDPSRYDADLRSALRGSAWRERANVLRFLGRYPEALAAIAHAESAFASTRFPDVDLARVNFVRATVLMQMGRFEEALPIAADIAATFARYGEDLREVHAGLLEGGILHEMGRYEAAAERFRALVGPAESAGDAATLGLLFNALGAAAQELGDLVTAATSFQRALAWYEYLGMEVEKVRTSWSLALIAISRGETERGLTMLTETAAAFERRGCTGDAALVWLDVAEQHAIAGRNAQVAAICERIIERFTEAGMTSSAVSALQYLREATAAQRASAPAVRHVRQYVRRLSSEPALLFAPLPEP